MKFLCNARIECPWLDNKPFTSCIPEGVYTVQKDETTTHILDSMGGRTWYLTGDTVSRHKSPDAERFAVAIHIGNTVRDVQGCLAPGMWMGSLGGRMAVLSSRDAMRHLRNHLPESFELTITSIWPQRG